MSEFREKACQCMECAGASRMREIIRERDDEVAKLRAQIDKVRGTLFQIAHCGRSDTFMRRLASRTLIFLSVPTAVPSLERKKADAL